MKPTLFAVTFLFAPLALAQVSVSDAWVRGTVPAQKATGAYMQLKSAQTLVLVGAESPIAGAVEIHEMRMDGDMMRMRPLPRLELPGGKEIKLQPGGYHLMLLDLKQPLRAGESVPLKLRFVAADKTVQDVEIKATVRSLDGK